MLISHISWRKLRNNIIPKNWSIPRRDHPIDVVGVGGIANSRCPECIQLCHTILLSLKFECAEGCESSTETVPGDRNGGGWVFLAQQRYVGLHPGTHCFVRVIKASMHHTVFTFWIGDQNCYNICQQIRAGGCRPPSDHYFIAIREIAD